MSSDERFLEASASIAREIIAAAVWDEGRCSWIGAIDGAAPLWRAEYHALGPSLYGGTAGVGLFLAHVATATGDKRFREAAAGALRHATSRAVELPAERRDGFHAGTLGIAWAAARAARLIEEEEIHEHAVAVLTQAPPPTGSRRCHDVVSGMAGSILGLLALADELDDPRLVEYADGIGDRLIREASITSYGWSWAIPGRRHRGHLCGIAHGAAGIGLALLELFATTREERYRMAATGAFAYEHSWLDVASGRWPDLRVGGRRRGALATIDSGITGTWCYGEAGIALTRLRAIDVLGPGPHLGDADVAVDTTCRHVADSLPYAIGDLSLCHGLGGAADVLLAAASRGDGRWYEAAARVTDLGRVALKRYAQKEQTWPSGIAGKTTPGLFLGLSGIGWLFLRLHDPETPSPLAPKNFLERHDAW